MRDINLSDRTQSRRTVLVYGDTRSGKTRWAATAPRPLFLSDVTESGWTTMQYMDPSLFYEPGRPPIVWGIETMTDMAQAYERVKPLIARGDVKTIVIDSLTFYADLYLNALFNAQGAKRDARSAYGDLGLHMRDLRVRWHSLPVNIIWLCLAKHPDDSDKSGGPLIPGQQATKFAAGCDNSFYFRSVAEQGGIRWEIRTKKYGGYFAGGREEGLLPDPLPDHTFRAFEDLVMEGRAGIPAAPVIEAPAQPSPVVVVTPPKVAAPTVRRIVAPTGR